MIVYVTTSAALKLVVQEDESAALAEEMQRRREHAEDLLVSSLLLHTELHCAANRRPELISRRAVADVLSTISLVTLEPGDLATAPLLAGRLLSADAIHLAAALRLDAQAMFVYDGELAATAEAAGITPLSPR